MRAAVHHLATRVIPAWSSSAHAFYERHELALDVAFFAGGFLFDVVTVRAGLDHTLVTLQQAAYLTLVGGILYFEFVHRARPEMAVPARLARAWEYRSLALHWCLGALMNLYSIFFLLSASTLASAVFVGLLFAAVALNEIKPVRRRGVDIKVGLFVLCVFCFFSLLTPLAFGHVGRAPFAASLAATVAALVALYGLLRLALGRQDLNRRLLLPGLSVMATFVACYMAGIIPPVPMAARTMGVYHLVAREGDEFALYRDAALERAGWFGGQTFIARPGDRIHAFAAVYAPAPISDAVFMRWERRHPVEGWQTTDRIPLEITGGREGGFRAFTVKERYSGGRWRVTVETGDGRPIGRLAFTVTETGIDPDRALVRETY